MVETENGELALFNIANVDPDNVLIYPHNLMYFGGIKERNCLWVPYEPKAALKCIIAELLLEKKWVKDDKPIPFRTQYVKRTQPSLIVPPPGMQIKQ
jgi:hypothetical protein